MHISLGHDHQVVKEKLEVLTVKLKFCVICLRREILREIAQLLRQHLLATVKHSYDIQERNTRVSVPTQKSNANV
jgi:hypothetical protein